MFCNGGSDAVEGALKISRQYWKVKGQPERTKFISLKQGYHGVHFGGMSVNGNTNFRRAYEPLLPGCFHVDTPWLYRNPYTDDPIELGRICAGLLEREIQFQGADTVAAFIAEPIQGAGGVIIPPETYWPKIREILAKYDILFVADEVICGFGRTGEWFGSDFYGNKPDLMTIAKGLTSGYVPMGGLIVSDKVFQVINAGGDFNHGFTYSGHPVAAAVGLENLRILKDEKVIEQVKAETAPYLQKRLRELADHPLVGEVRGVGMLGAIELAKNKQTRERFPSEMGVGMICRGHCFENGLIMRAVGDTMIISPPLVISHAEIDELVDKARKCLDLTAAEVLV